jgi:hypothetical protein
LYQPNVVVDPVNKIVGKVCHRSSALHTAKFLSVARILDTRPDTGGQNSHHTETVFRETVWFVM